MEGVRWISYCSSGQPFEAKPDFTLRDVQGSALIIIGAVQENCATNIRSDRPIRQRDNRAGGMNAIVHAGLITGDKRRSDFFRKGKVGKLPIRHQRIVEN